MSSERPSANDVFHWMPAGGMSGPVRDALVTPADSRVTFDVVLPPNAIVSASYALSLEGEDRGLVSVEFEIRVRTEGRESSGRCAVGVSATGQGRRWQPLQVRVDESGPARIVLTTRRTQGDSSNAVQGLWGDPRIESPRPLADFRSGLRSALAGRTVGDVWRRALPPDQERLYQLWVRAQEPSRAALQEQRAWAATRADVLSLITHVTGNGPWSDRTAASLIAQSYPGWQWILVAADDAMDRARRLAEHAGNRERALVLRVPSGTTRAAAWNAGLDATRGELAAVIGEHDTLAPSALYEIASANERSPGCDILYSDEDLLPSGESVRREPRFKPDWSPELLLAGNYIGRLAMLRVPLVRAVGGFRDLASPVEEWDLYLRMSRVTARIRRVPKCLYHRDEPGAPQRDDGGKAVLEHVQVLDGRADVERSQSGPRVIWSVRGEPTVSIVIPNRNAAGVLRQCVTGLLERTAHRRLEIIIVDNSSTDPDTIGLYRALEREARVRVLPFPGPFNFSAACNAGAAAGTGELLLFLNNDIEVIDPEWLTELIRWAQRPDVGVVGAKLLYPDRLIQHAGVVFGLGLVGHIFARAAEGTTSVFGSTECYRNYLAVTGACQMLRRDVFVRLGGFDERFRLTFSDVVLCMEAWKTGYRVIYTPYARLIHHESYTRQRNESPPDMILLAEYLRANDFEEDPYFHPEIDPKSAVPAVRPPYDPAARAVIRNYVDRVLATVNAGARISGT
jgi:GT2 family glycosyltransferase